MDLTTQTATRDIKIINELQLHATVAFDIPNSP